ncbi:MAG TPA: serine hydrolase, partial [Gemmatimonadaceae bacterium]
HRSGIARGELVWLGSGFNREQVLHHLRFLKPESPFRSQWSYQNMMFLAAGEAAGKAAGTSWDELVKTRIFTPLGMTYSQTSSRGMTATDVAIPHGQRKDSVYDEPMFDGYNIGPAGAILSNAHDMAQWLRFQLNDAVVNGKRLIAAPAFHETHTPQAISTLGGGRPAPGDTAEPATHFHTYGFGWFVEDYHHQLRWQHGGNTPGMTTAVGMLPEKHFGVVVLSSMASASLPGILMDYIMDRDLNLPMKDLSAEAHARTLAQRRRADSASVAQAGAPKGQSSTPLNAFVGTYVDSLYGELTISLDNGSLELTRSQWKGPLEYVSANNWRWITPGDAPLPELPLKFEIAPDNTVTGVYFGLGADATLMMKKSARGGRGGRGGRP